MPGVILFRVAKFTLHPAQLLVGVLEVPLPWLMLGTAIGFPAVIAGVLLGGEVTRWLAGVFGLA